MKDLTRGSITNHLFAMAAPFAVGSLSQMVCQIVNMYFVAQFGPAAVAGVMVADSVIYIVAALTQMLGVGAASMIARAVGAKNQATVDVVFNQALALSIVCGASTLTALYIFTRVYLQSLSADPSTIAAGTTFMRWVLPGYALLFPWQVILSTLRCTGAVRPAVTFNALTLVTNLALAPVLIAGWGGFRGLGVLGAGLTITLSTSLGLLAVCAYMRAHRHLHIRPKLMRPRLQEWGRILHLGLPAGVEFALIFFSTAVVYYVLRDFGASAQAGFGIGSRILQPLLVPGLALAFAAGPIAGQNFGAQKNDRVRETFRTTTFVTSIAMLATMIVLHWFPETLVRFINSDTASIVGAVLFLQLRAWSLLPQGVVYTCANMFLGIGKTSPALISSGIRFAAFAVPAIWVSRQPWFHLEQIWYLWVVSTTLQAVVSLWLLHVEFKRRLPTLALESRLSN